MDILSVPGAIIGCDLAGSIVRLGPNLTDKSLKVGDRVAAFVHGGKFSDKVSWDRATLIGPRAHLLRMRKLHPTSYGGFLLVILRRKQLLSRLL